MIDELNIIRFWDPSQQRSRLAEMQPAQQERDNWWRGVIESATRMAVSSEKISMQDRQAWVQLALTALDCAHDMNAVNKLEVAIQRANLSAALSRYGDPIEFNDSLKPDDVAQNCLACIDLSYEEAASKTVDWRAQNIEVIRSLRKIKNLVTPLVSLADKIEDEPTRLETQRWINLLPVLP